MNGLYICPIKQVDYYVICFHLFKPISVLLLLISS